jgi:hypothetical protein
MPRSPKGEKRPADYREAFDDPLGFGRVIETISAPFAPSIAAVIVAPIESTARRMGSASKCA